LIKIKSYLDLGQKLKIRYLEQKKLLRKKVIMLTEFMIHE
jgi:hypothetical protein